MYYCDPSCIACSGPSPNQCLTCGPGYFLSPETTTTTLPCTKCNLGCLTCNSSTDCLTCDTQNDYYPLPDNSTKCYKTCPTNYWRDNNSKICASAIKEGYYYDYNNNQFVECYPTCKSCRETGTEQNQICYTCKDGFYPLSSLELTNCADKPPSYYYNNKITGKFEICSKLCNECEYEIKKSCSFCDEDYLDLDGRSCTKVCPLSSLPDKVNICRKCIDIGLIDNNGKCMFGCDDGYVVLNGECVKQNDPCVQSNICKNNGECSYDKNSKEVNPKAICKCKDNFIGEFCETKFDLLTLDINSARVSNGVTLGSGLDKDVIAQIVRVLKDPSEVSDEVLDKAFEILENEFKLVEEGKIFAEPDMIKMVDSTLNVFITK